MKNVAMALVMVAGLSGAADTAEAQQPSCKACSEQQRACMKNYAGATCKSEYQMCMKSCEKKSRRIGPWRDEKVAVKPLAGGGSKVSGALAEAITRDFGSFDRWRAEFSAMGKAEGGGSGWVILAYSPRDKLLVNQWAADHTTTIAGGRPVLVLDMYEHAYHMDYGAAAALYVDVYMDAIRWDNATKLYEQYARES
jgi:superoxide dismutase